MIPQMRLENPVQEEQNHRDSKGKNGRFSTRRRGKKKRKSLVAREKHH